MLNTGKGDKFRDRMTRNPADQIWWVTKDKVTKALYAWEFMASRKRAWDDIYQNLGLDKDFVIFWEEGEWITIKWVGVFHGDLSEEYEIFEKLLRLMDRRIFLQAVFNMNPWSYHVGWDWDYYLFIGKEKAEFGFWGTCA